MEEDYLRGGTIHIIWVGPPGGGFEIEDSPLTLTVVEAVVQLVAAVAADLEVGPLDCGHTFVTTTSGDYLIFWLGPPRW